MGFESHEPKAKKFHWGKKNVEGAFQAKELEIWRSGILRYWDAAREISRELPS